MVDRRHLLTLGAGLGAALLLTDAAAAASVPDLPGLRRRLAAGRTAFGSARYAELAARLPALLKDAWDARQLLTGAGGRAASAVLAQVHVLASEVAVKRGDTAAAWVHARAAVAAAEACGNPIVLAEATRVCATPLRRQGRADEAVLLLQDTIGRLDASSSRAEAGLVAAAGTLALTAAYSASLDGNEMTALSLMDMASEAAGRLEAASGARPARLTAHQVLLYRVGVHHLLGQDVAAVRIARQIDPRALPSGERRARLGTDTARALLALGDYDRTFTELCAVEAAAAEEASRPSVRALTGRLLVHRPRLAGLQDFAARTRAIPA